MIFKCFFECNYELLLIFLTGSFAAVNFYEVCTLQQLPEVVTLSLRDDCAFAVVTLSRSCTSRLYLGIFREMLGRVFDVDFPRFVLQSVKFETSAFVVVIESEPICGF